MNNDIFMQSTFSRSLHNEAKMGAYYTDTDHCVRLARLFDWPDEEVCVLEPSIGDGKAVQAITQNAPKSTIFGVELNKSTFDQLEQKFPYLLNEDFLHGVKISRKAFSFCFANPPYGVDQDSKERLEKLFIEKLFGYLKQDAVFCLVVPYYVLTDKMVKRAFVSRFQLIAAYRFDDAVYKQFQQVVVIGKRRQMIECMRSYLKDFDLCVGNLEDIPYIPKEDEDIKEKIQVLPSSSDQIEYFTTLKFNPVKAAISLKNSSLLQELEEFAVAPEYSAAELGRPAVPLKKDLLYLCALSGGGQGLVGSAKKGDLHLQRGVVNVVQDHNIRHEEHGDGVEVVESSYSQITLNIIESDGSITTLS